jgi:hypothetical protein
MREEQARAILWGIAMTLFALLVMGWVLRI